MIALPLPAAILDQLSPAALDLIANRGAFRQLRAAARAELRRRHEHEAPPEVQRRLALAGRKRERRRERNRRLVGDG